MGLASGLTGGSLLGYLLRRLAASLLILLLVLTLAFFFLHLLPGGPVHFFEGQKVLTPGQQRNLERIYGLDRPLPEQYLRWIGSVARWDWGTSISQQRPVSTAISEAFSATVVLSLAALACEYGLALLLGTVSARRRGSVVDHGIRIATLLLYSQPVFWLGLMAILLFSYVWPVLPAGHMHSVDADLMSPAGRLLDLARHLLLPAVVMALASTGATARFVRSSLIEVMSQDYIRTARAKGLSERRVVWVHGLRNAIVPLILVFTLTLPGMLSSAVVVEVVFSWPGLGRLLFQAVSARDYPLILGATALAATAVVLSNLLADLLHALADPRVRDA
ncbi:MAG TPA: ABC transporter permease [Thermoanaerobaculia bacterium]|nr:ABC transporter permease [Thermoanaerobaculia bacterium]